VTAVHFGEQLLAFRVDEIHFAEIHHSLAPGGGRRGRLPALAQFRHPWSGQLAFEAESQFPYTVEQSDLQHAGTV
jgi:hypothetical protein